MSDEYDPVEVCKNNLRQTVTFLAHNGVQLSAVILIASAAYNAAKEVGRAHV